MRSRARLKFLIEKWGMDKFKEEVLAERAKLPADPRWIEFLHHLNDFEEKPLKPPGELPAINGSERLTRWIRTNVRDQRQAGYVTVAVTLPLGDISSNQLRALADIVREFTNGTIRTTVEQNFLLRWVSKSDIPALYQALESAGLGEPGAGTILDIVACPGTDTCKLGISSSRGLAAELRTRLATTSFQLDQAIQDLHIKISGCFNSCGQHHVADIGFYGVSRTMNAYKVPHFQVVLGGQWEENAGAYGLPVVAIPSKRIPDALDLISRLYLQSRRSHERFSQFIKRIGKAKIREILDPLTENPPEHAEQPQFYSDWGDPRQYSIGDIGKGECAGEVVTQYEFTMTAAERMVFGAQIHFDDGNADLAKRDAHAAMIKAAKALVQLQYDDVTEDDPDEVVDEFKERFCDTEVFFDPFAGPKFANYLFAAHEQLASPATAESVRYTIEEAQLFIEAVHSCYNRLRSAGLSEAGSAR
jgi:sulfite reductase (ferredoxin)